MFFKPQPRREVLMLSAPSAAPVEPLAIRESALTKLQDELAFHANEMQRLGLLIADANARLLHHTAAHDAIQDAYLKLSFQDGAFEYVVEQEPQENSGPGETERGASCDIGRIDEGGAGNTEPGVPG